MTSRPTRGDDRSNLLSSMAPATQAAIVTPSDDDDNVPAGATLYVGVSGDLVVLPEGNSDNDTVTFKGVPVGFFDMLCRRVYAGGTTATDLVAVW